VKVLVDTCIWSHALRTQKPEFAEQIDILKTLIAEQRVLLIGPVRQEVLSGYSDFNKFELLKAKLNCFENTAILDDDYLVAARFYNQCRKQGVQGSHIDLLICAVAVRLNAAIFTTDKDFGFYQHHIPIQIYPISLVC